MSEASAATALASVLNHLHISFTTDNSATTSKSSPTASVFLTVEKNKLSWLKKLDPMADTMRSTQGAVISLPSGMTTEVPTAILASLEFLHRLGNNTTTKLDDRQIKASKHVQETYPLQDRFVIPELTGKMNDASRPEMRTLLGHLKKKTDGRVAVSRVVPSSESVTTQQSTQPLSALKTSLSSAVRPQEKWEDWRLTVNMGVSKETDQVLFARGFLDALDVECRTPTSNRSMNTIRAYLYAPRVAP